MNSIGWRTFQNCILGAASADASTMAVALGTLYQVAALGGHSVSQSPLTEIFENVIGRHAPRGEGSEVAWSLWGALAWSVSLSAGSAKAVSAMDDDIGALLALDAETRGLFPPGTLDKQRWGSYANAADALRSDHWMLSYEANQHNWLPCPAVTSDPVFFVLHTAGVGFYDIANTTAQFPAGARGFSGGTLPHYYA